MSALAFPARGYPPFPLAFAPMRRIRLSGLGRDGAAQNSGAFGRARDALNNFFVRTDTVTLSARFGRTRYAHAADVVVAGANPVLLAIAAETAAREGLNVVVCPVPGDDGWSYPLLVHPAIRHLTDATIGLQANAPTRLRGAASGRAELHAWGDTLFRALALRLQAARGLVGLLTGAPALSLGADWDDSEGFLYADGDAPEAEPAHAVLSDLQRLFRRHIAPALTPLRLASGPRALNFVFGGRIVLVSPIGAALAPQQEPGGAVRFASPNPHVRLLGMAAARPASRADALDMTIASLLQAARGAADEELSHTRLSV